MSFGARSASKAAERGTYSWLITTRRQTQEHLTATIVATSRQHTKSWLRISQFFNPSGVANLSCEEPARPCRALGKNKKSGAILSNISRSCRHRANEREVGTALSAPGWAEPASHADLIGTVITRLARSQFLQAGGAVGSLGLTENYRMIGVASGDRRVNDQLVTMSELVDVGAQRCRTSSHR